MTKRHTWRKAAAVLVLAAASIMFCGYKAKGSGGQKMIPSHDISLDKTVDAGDYCQRDKRWCDDRIGTSRTDMYHSGCMICCIAASLYLQGDSEYTPASLNDFLGNNNVYTSGGAIQWDIMEKCMKDTDVDLSVRVSDAAVEKELKAGYAVIAKVKRPSGAYHWILITGADGGTYSCMDPIEGNITLDEYGDTVYSVRVVRYSHK